MDWSKFKRALGPTALVNPTSVARAARDSVKAEKAQGLVRVVGDVGRVQAKAGTQAALDSMKLAHGPSDMARMSRLAAAKGGKTRAILKVAGRGAIVLTMGTFNLASWMFWAVFTVFGFVSALKRWAERATERSCARRRLRRAREAERCARELRRQAERERRAAAAIPAGQPAVIRAMAPSLVPAIVPSLPPQPRTVDCRARPDNPAFAAPIAQTA
jgi:hypothetical protein